MKISDLAVAQNLLVSSLAGSWKLKRWVRERRRRNPGRLKMTAGGAAHRPRHNLTEVQNFVAASVIPASGPSARDLRFDQRSKISLLLLSLSSSADLSLPCQDLNLNPWPEPPPVWEGGVMMGKICRPCVFFRLPLYSDDEEVDVEDRERTKIFSCTLELNCALQGLYGTSWSILIFFLIPKYFGWIANLCLFFYWLTFEKVNCSIFALSVGLLVGITIIFFNICRHTSLLLTHYHFIQAVSIFTDPVPPNTNQHHPVLF